MPSLRQTFHLQSDRMKAIIVFAFTIAFGGMVFLFASWQMNGKANKSMQPYIKSQEFINQYIDSLKKPDHLSEKYFNVFKAQQKILSMRKEHYLGLSRLFFRNYYAVLIVLMLYSVVGGVVIFLLVNKGWKDSSIILKTLFLAIVMVVTFCGFFPSVFKQQWNSDENIKYYMNYTRAEIDIMDQLSRFDNPLFPQKCVKDPVEKKEVVSYKPDSVAFYRIIDSSIAVNNKNINNLTNYILTIDANEIKSMGDIYKIISKNSTGNADSAGR